jgi:hypothetical protein
MAIPSTRERVPANTAEDVNRRIQEETEARVGYYAEQPSEIPTRLAELDAEWDIERTIEANAALLALIGILLGAFVHPYWLALPAAVALFLLQHSIQGWCPPVPILRRMKFRTEHEIAEEQHALKALRGDFEGVEVAPDRAYAALTAARF